MFTSHEGEPVGVCYFTCQCIKVWYFDVYFNLSAVFAEVWKAYHGYHEPLYVV